MGYKVKEFKRYAVYFLPPAQSALADFGSAWLGWDVQTGASVPYPSWVPVAHAEQVATPVKYGFHGTLKPPIRLASGTELASLQYCLADIAQAHQAFTLPALQLTDMGGFLCFTLSAPSVALQAVADDCVCRLDDWRAPPEAAELRRRRLADLNPRQAQLLNDWGYPYVLDQFRFHLTLTGKLPDSERAAQLALLQRHTHDLLSSALTMSDLCLCGEGVDGRFYLIERYPLAG